MTRVEIKRVDVVADCAVGAPPRQAHRKQLGGLVGCVALRLSGKIQTRNKRRAGSARAADRRVRPSSLCVVVMPSCEEWWFDARWSRDRKPASAAWRRNVHLSQRHFSEAQTHYNLSASKNRPPRPLALATNQQRIYRRRAATAHDGIFVLPNTGYNHCDSTPASRGRFG